MDENRVPISGALIYSEHPVIAGDLEALRVTGPDRSIPRPRSKSNARGQFECAGIEVGEARLWAYAHGNLWTLTDVIEVPQGTTVDAGLITLEAVPSELTITGVVLTADGARCPGATVHCNLRHDRLESKVGADGTFRIFLADHAPVVLAAEAPDRRDGLSSWKNAAPGAEVELHLKPAWNLSVAVIDSDARPIEGVSVRPLMENRDGLPGSEWVKTGADGRVPLSLPLQSVLLGVDKAGFEYKSAGPFEPSGSPSEVSITLVRYPTIRGRVVQNGEPVRGAKVEVAVRRAELLTMQQGFTMRLFYGGRSSETYSDDDGRFECPVPADWTSTSIVVTAKGLATGEVALELQPGQGATEVTIEMTSGGSISGHLLALSLIHI